jgi:2-C-methyl-D-erythritol 4-phosphate cytidylyltransferase / 2-C-methyl-D-erythritol 2,4-cyclodiphosphate synthase
MAETPHMDVAAVIVAAGRGSRVGGDLPKQWRRLGGRSVAARTVDVFDSHPDVSRLVLVLHPEDIEAGLWPGASGVEVVTGGASRVQSVRAGLSALEGRCSHVLIHDVARPLVTHAVIDRVLAALETHKGAAPALAVTDALWRGNAGLVTGTEDRSGLFRAQTPQGFEMGAILAAHDSYSGEAADDVEIARAAGIEVAIVEGDAANLKITAPGDFARAEAVLRERNGAAMDIRLGNGFDVHRFGPGDHVMLCGVRVAHERGLQGHSDADVGMHAVTDAIYGALAEGDIGRHFPPSDPQWKGADSAVFLAHAAALVREKGFRIGNVDCTLICEFPKIGPHAGAMQERMGEIMELEANRVSVKATTSEKLGFTGRGEGIAALATVTLVRE